MSKTEILVPVHGRTYGIKEELKAMGGKWDSKGKVWMVPRSREKEAIELIENYKGRYKISPEEKRRRIAREKEFIFNRDTPEEIYLRAMDNVDDQTVEARLDKNKLAWEMKCILAREVGHGILLRILVIDDKVQETYAMPDGSIKLRYYPLYAI